MEFLELTREEFQKFSEKHPLESFFQTVGNADLRASYGAKIHYLGVKDDNHILAAGMFTENPCMFGQTRLYAPEGILADYHNVEVLSFFTKHLKKYARKCNAMFVRMDPNVVYQPRNANGEIIPGSKPETEVVKTLKKLGYHHFGFTRDYRFSQSRWNFRIHLDIDYDTLKTRFSKSTRKNIENMYEKGVRVRRSHDEKDIEIATEMFQKTADRKHFDLHRDSEYYKRMQKYFRDKVLFYIAYVDTDIYLSYTKKELEKAKDSQQIILDKMKKDMVGKKLTTQLENSKKKILRFEEEVEEAERMKAQYPKGVDVGALVSVQSGKEYITLTSGILTEYKKFMPKYVMYNEHILDAYQWGFSYVNFFGISGYFTPGSLLYGVYEFKRGFSGEVEELVGEFNLKVSNTYYIYRILRRLKIWWRIIKKY